MIMIIIGLLSGALSGMGIGGGVILIPSLTFFLHMEQQAAQNVNLIYFIPTASIAIVTHVKNDNIEKRVLWKLIIFGVGGALIGSFIAINMDGELLRKCFGYFLLIMGIIEFLRKE